MAAIRPRRQRCTALPRAPQGLPAEEAEREQCRRHSFDHDGQWVGIHFPSPEDDYGGTDPHGARGPWAGPWAELARWSGVSALSTQRAEDAGRHADQWRRQIYSAFNERLRSVMSAVYRRRRKRRRGRASAAALALFEVPKRSLAKIEQGFRNCGPIFIDAGEVLPTGGRGLRSDAVAREEDMGKIRARSADRRPRLRRRALPGGLRAAKLKAINENGARVGRTPPPKVPARRVHPRD
jgi:hypothetical protein